MRRMVELMYAYPSGGLRCANPPYGMNEELTYANYIHVLRHSYPHVFCDVEKHHLPHIHADYQGAVAVYSIIDGGARVGRISEA